MCYLCDSDNEWRCFFKIIEVHFCAKKSYPHCVVLLGEWGSVFVGAVCAVENELSTHQTDKIGRTEIPQMQHHKGS